MANTRLICIQRSFDHWAEHSGYHQFLKHLPSDFHVTLVHVPRGRARCQGFPFWKKFWVRTALRIAGMRANPWTTARDLQAEFEILSLLRSHRQNGEKTIVHFLTGESGFNYFGSLRKSLGQVGNDVRLVASYHQPESKLAGLLPYKHRTRQLDLVLAVGTSQLPFFRFLPDTRVRAVPLGIDTDFYRPAHLSAHLSADGGPIYCVVVGHWMRDFDALEKVIQKRPERVVFRIVAPEAHIDRFRAFDNVRLYSGIDDDELLDLYQSSHIGLLPLTDTTANNGLLEMMACGLPIITTRVGSIEDYLSDASGILIARNDTDGLERAVRRLATSSVERIALGKAARRRALELDLTRVAIQMAEVYRRL